MLEFGFTNALLLSESGEVIAGHGRLLAAMELGFAEVPVMVAEGWTHAQVQAYRIADNQLTLLGEWDDDLLAAELHALNADGFDLDLTGFDGAELDRLLAPLDEEATDGEEAIPEPPANPVSRPGDLWLLGEHRLLCGDSTSADDVARLRAGAKPHLMVTDPPYGVDYDPSWRNEADGGHRKRVGTVSNDDRVDWREAWALFPGDVAYVWHSGRYGKTVADSLDAHGFAVRSEVVWVKNRFALGQGHYHWQHESCFYAVRDGGDSHWQGARDQSTVWEIPNRGDGDDETVHGTQKPIECMLRPILNNSTRGDLVYEPFSGSGTTIMAAERSGRRCLAMELDPAYVDVAVRRWEAASGNHATLEADGRPFADVAAERLA